MERQHPAFCLNPPTSNPTQSPCSGRVNKVVKLRLYINQTKMRIIVICDKLSMNTRVLNNKILEREISLCGGVTQLLARPSQGRIVCIKFGKRMNKKSVFSRTPISVFPLLALSYSESS